jgi:hypothetical protein
MKILMHAESHIVGLVDGTQWQIYPADLDLTLGWPPTTELEIMETIVDQFARVGGKRGRYQGARVAGRSEMAGKRGQKHLEGRVMSPLTRAPFNGEDLCFCSRIVEPPMGQRTLVALRLPPWGAGWRPSATLKTGFPAYANRRRSGQGYAHQSRPLLSLVQGCPDTLAGKRNRAVSPAWLCRRIPTLSAGRTGR